MCTDDRQQTSSSSVAAVPLVRRTRVVIALLHGHGTVDYCTTTRWCSNLLLHIALLLLHGHGTVDYCTTWWKYAVCNGAG